MDKETKRKYKNTPSIYHDKSLIKIQNTKVWKNDFNSKLDSIQLKVSETSVKKENEIIKSIKEFKQQTNSSIESKVSQDVMKIPNALLTPNRTVSKIQVYKSLPPSIQEMNGLFEFDMEVVENKDIPDSFDWRDYENILEPIHQGYCGSCYAVATSMAFSDRVKIASLGEFKEQLSIIDMVNCGESFIENTFHKNQYSESIRELIDNETIIPAQWYVLKGCEGGLLASASDYCVLRGLPLESEYPYPFNPHNPIDDLNQKKVNDKNYCSERFYKPLTFAKKARALTLGLEGSFPIEDVDLKKEILLFNMENMKSAVALDGPITTGLNIYSDFYYYPALEKIYSRKEEYEINGKKLKTTYEGAHAVVIVGYGEEKDESSGKTIPYWICRNSWGEKWGFNGYFMIMRGINLCNIEYNATCVIPDLNMINIHLDQKQIDNYSRNSLVEKSNSTYVIDPFWYVLIALDSVALVAVAIAIGYILSKKKRKKQVK